MMRRLRQLLTFCAGAAVIAACSSSIIAPLTDGPWFTGHVLIGPEMSLDLTWTPNSVYGEGSYLPGPPGAICGSDTVSGSGNFSIIAGRSGNTITGSMKFDSGVHLGYTGTLTSPSRLDGFLVANDGTKCSLSFFRALIP